MCLFICQINNSFNDSNFISSITHFLSIFILLKNIEKVHILKYELYSITNGEVKEPSPDLNSVPDFNDTDGRTPHG